jgi:hypothetical protein
LKTAVVHLSGTPALHALHRLATRHGRELSGRAFRARLLENVAAEIVAHRGRFPRLSSQARAFYRRNARTYDRLRRLGRGDDALAAALRDWEEQLCAEGVPADLGLNAAPRDDNRPTAD